MTNEGQTPGWGDLDDGWAAAALVLAHADDVVIRYRTDGTVMAASPALTRVFGYEPSDIVGTRFRLEVPEEREENTLAFVSVARGHFVPGFRYRGRARCADGSTLWCEARMSPVRDASGAVDSVVAVIRDIDDHIRTEEQLHRSLQDYRLIVENADELMFRADSDLCLEWVSPAVTPALGWLPQDLIGQQGSTLAHPDDLAKLRMAEEELRSSGVVTSEMRVRTAQGTYRWMRLTVTEVTTEGGLVRVGSARPTDDERHARDLLTRSEARLKATMDTLIDPHVVFQAVRDDTGQIIDFLFTEANEAACRTQGMDYQQLVGTRLLDLVPESRNGVFDIYRRVVETGEPLILDDHRFAMGPPGRETVRHFDVRAMRLGDGMSATWRDVTDKYRSQKALAASEERFRLAMAVAPIGMAVLDLSEGFTEVNPALCQLLGRDPSWLTGHRLENVLVPGEVGRFRRIRESLAAGHTNGQSVEQQFVTGSGQVVCLDHSIALVRDTEGRPVSFVCQFVDRTGRVGSVPASTGRLSTGSTTSVMVLSSDQGRFAGLATSALLERRAELLVLPPAVVTDLDVRLKQDEPDVVLTVLQPGASGTAELSQILDALEHAPETGIVVLSPGRRHDAQVLLTQRPRPSAYLAVATVQDDTFVVRAIEAVAQGLVAVNADWGTGASVVAGTSPTNRSPLQALTQRESDVLACIAEGLDNASIAESLTIGTKAVENYVGSIFRKLGLNDEVGTHKRVRAASIYWTGR